MVAMWCLACGAPTDEGVRLSTPTSDVRAESTRTAPTPLAPTATPGGPVAMCVRAAASTAAGALTIVDKEHALPPDFEPGDLIAVPDRLAVSGFPGQRMRREAAAALVRLLDDADNAGVELRVRSTFRSFSEQAVTFQYWVDLLGERQAERESARPGHSEHQLGTVADVVSRSIGWELVTPFGETREGKWLQAHAQQYGFAISYPEGGEDVTGYIYEPWHIRYIGTQCSNAWYASGMILVRFLEAVQKAS